MASCPAVRVASLLTVAVALVPVSARAHHVVVEHGIAPVMPQTAGALEIAAASFDMDGRRGRWESVTPSLEWSPHPRLSFMGALPFARVQYDGDDARNGLGLSDLSLAAKASLWSTPHGELLVAAGVGVELPTGDKDAGLSGDHVELAPFATVASTIHRANAGEVLLYALLSPRVALGGSHAHGPGHATGGSVLAPHGDGELWGRFAAAWAGQMLWASGGVEGAAVWHGEGWGQLAARAEGGVMVADDIRLLAGVDAHLAGERRFGWRGRLGVAWLR